MPGLLVQLGIFGALFVGLRADRRVPGRRHRAQAGHARAAGSALLLGRVLRDVVVLIVQAILLIAGRIPLGLRAPRRGRWSALVVVALLGAAFASVSYAVALIAEERGRAGAAAQRVAMPVLLLSGILLPMTLAPPGCKSSDVNPFKHVVDGVRALFRGDFTGGTAWWGLGVTAALVCWVLVRDADVPARVDLTVSPAAAAPSPG